MRVPNQSGRSEAPGDAARGEADDAIYIRAVVDVGRVLQAHPDILKDGETPTAVDFDEGNLILSATNVADQHAGRLALIVPAGATLRFFAKSGSNNFEFAALIQDVRAGDDDALLESGEPVGFTRTAVAPDAQEPAQLAAPTEQTFTFWQGSVTDAGTQPYSLSIALYDRDEDGQPRFAGLYRWDVTLTVLSAPSIT